jgi:hypothetical protein
MNAPPLPVSCAPSMDDRSALYIQTNEEENQQKQKDQPVPGADNNPTVLCNFIQI